MNESAAREAIAHYCRLLWKRRLVTGTSGNVSVSLPDGAILVTPTQRSLRTVSAADLVLLDASGSPQENGAAPTSELPLHLAAYRARCDIRAVVHTHPTFCVVWTKSGLELPRDTVGARETLGDVALTAYAPPGSEELADVTSRAFAAGVNTVLMERHGVSAVAADLETAFNLTDLVEEAARIAYFSTVLIEPPPL